MSVIKKTAIDVNYYSNILNAFIEEHENRYWICVTIAKTHPLLQLTEIDSKEYHLHDEGWNGDPSVFNYFEVPGKKYGCELYPDFYEYNDDGSVGFRYEAYYTRDKPKDYYHACNCINALIKELNDVKWIRDIVEKEIQVHEQRLSNYKKLLTTLL